MAIERDDFEARADEIITALRKVRVADGGQRDRILEDLCGEADQLWRRRSWREAYRCCDTAGRLAQDVSDTETRNYIEGCIKMYRGAIDLSRQDVAKARTCFKDAAIRFRTGGFERSRSVARMGVGLSFLLEDRPDQALRELRSSRELLRIQATDDVTWELVNCVQAKLEEVLNRYYEAMSGEEEPESGQPVAADMEERSRQGTEHSDPPNGGLKWIPIVAVVHAGFNRLADQDHRGFLALDVDLARSITHAVVIEGYSMASDGIYPGDLVLVHEQQELRPGELGVFLITYAGELTETTLKRYHPKADHVCLRPMNEDEPAALIIPRQEDASRIIKRYEQRKLIVHPYVNADLKIVAKAYGLFRLFDRVQRRGKR